MVAWWSALHGAVALECNGQFNWMGPDSANYLFESTMQTVMRPGLT